MNIVSINTCLDGSTGRIMRQISETARRDGNICYTITSYQKKKNIKIERSIYDISVGGPISLYSHILLGRVTGLQGVFSVLATFNVINKLNKIGPDVIHIHNLHESYISIPILFRYIRKHNIPVVWTLHDAWAFTGHCPYFTMCGCEKWRTQCKSCDQYMMYPKCYYDHSKLMFYLKKKWFSKVANMHIITPSYWLAELARKSFLGIYDINVINNGIDLDRFSEKHSNILKAEFPGKFIVLGVSFDWSARKGIDVFVRLSRDLGDDFKIVLVGVDENLAHTLPQNIKTIEKTQNQDELAQLYSDADLFVNPTREENYPTVNMESIACGTPVVTYDTGGSPEIVANCGDVVEYDNYDDLLSSILKLKESPTMLQKLKNACRDRRLCFNMDERYLEYLCLYRSIMKERENNA